MTDPWYIGAQEHHERQHQRAKEAEEQRRLEAARQKAEQDAAIAAQTEMDKAVAEAIPLLTRFLQERGAAAQALLGASGSDRNVIIFGGDDEGGESSGVFLAKDGLRYELAVRAGYGSTPIEDRPASAKEAVEAFAYRGPGYEKPRQVRNIVEWLTERINAYLPR